MEGVTSRAMSGNHPVAVLRGVLRRDFADDLSVGVHPVEKWCPDPQFFPGATGLLSEISWQRVSPGSAGILENLPSPPARGVVVVGNYQATRLSYQRILNQDIGGLRLQHCDAVVEWGPVAHPEEARVDRDECTEVIVGAKRALGLTFQELADRVGRHVVWTTAAIMGQATMDAVEAEALAGILGLSSEVAADVAEALQQIPMKGSLDADVPVDPLIYRLHEITQVYGTTIKAVIHEKFGDGIMSAIDFEIDIERVPDPKGDRVKLTYNGKFLPYRKW